MATLYDSAGRPYDPNAAIRGDLLNRAGDPPKEDDFEAVSKALHLWSAGNARYQGFFEIGSNCYDFVRDKQWFAQDLAHFEKQRRLPLTVNIIKPKVRRVLGLQRQNRVDLMVSPVDTGGDKERAEWAYNYLRHFRYVNRAEKVGARVFMDGLLAMGVWRLFLKKDFDGYKVCVEAPPRGSVLFDPNHYDPRLTDCRWVEYTGYMRRAEIEANPIWKEAVKNVPFESQTDYESWWKAVQDVMRDDNRAANPDLVLRKEERYAVITLEERVQSKQLTAIDPNTGVKVADYTWPKEAVGLFQEMSGLKVVDYDCERLHVQHILPYFFIVLEDVTYPYSSYSFTPFASERFNSMLPDCTSYVHSMVGLQREKNVARSNTLETQVRAIRGGYKIYDKGGQGAGKKIQEDMDLHGHEIGRSYVLPEGVDIQPMQDPAILQGAIWREQKAESDMEEVSGVAAVSSFGGTTSGESGVKRRIRNEEGETAVYQYFDDYGEAEAVMYSGALDRFSVHGKAPQALAIIGDNPRDPQVQVITPAIMAKMREVQHYDVRIQEGPFMTMKKQIEQEERLVLMNVTGSIDPEAGKAILPTIWRGSTLPDGEQIANELMDAQAAIMETPPEITSPTGSGGFPPK